VRGAQARRHGLIALVTLACVVLARGARAAPPGHAELRRWSGSNAFTIPSGRCEIGLFQLSHYGVSDRLELALQPIAFFALPHLELKQRFFETEGLAAAFRYRVSYPTAFLGLVSREGSGGLLPATSDPPFAIQIEGDGVFSHVFRARQIVSLAFGLAVAPHASFEPEELPLLDFPFLYPRFAPVYSVLVPRASASLEGPVVAALHYALELRAFLMPELPDAGTAAAFEQSFSLEYRFGTRLGISAGLMASEAEYAIGYRLHFLPYLDARVGF
jgi:hypothetical protein